MIKIASFDSLQPFKKCADFISDGIDDQLDIANAIDDLPSGGGKIVLLGNTFNFSDSFPSTTKYITVEGAGIRTTKINFNLPNPGACITPDRYWAMRDFEIAGINNADHGIRLLADIPYTLFERIYISGTTKTGVRGEPGNSQNTFRNVLVRGTPEIGWKLYGVTNWLYSCQAMRSGAGPGSAFVIQLSGGGLFGCAAEDWEKGMAFDNYAHHVNIFYPHIEDCTYDFSMDGNSPPPENIRVFGGLHGGVVNNPNGHDILFYD